MPYTSNPHMPQVRMDAVTMVRKGHSMRSVARHFGYNVSTISKWVKRAPHDGRKMIPTKSSRPHTQPHALPQTVIDLIVELRLKRRRCAEVIHHEVRQMGISVSLSSVKRVLKRAGLLQEKSKWKKYHTPVPRPVVAYPGALVQLDTIHIQPLLKKPRFYIYTLLDVYSRWAYAWVSEKLSAGRTVLFLRQAQSISTFEFSMLQTDHGPEFSSWFTKNAGIAENPHIYQEAIDAWLPYYNNERAHLSLNFLSPSKVVQRY